VVLATRGKGLLESHNSKVRAIFQRIFAERGIEVRYLAEAVGVEASPQNSTTTPGTVNENGTF
jgi:hypothetical protein